MEDKRQKGKKLRIISKLVEQAIEELSIVFDNKAGLSQKDLDIVRAILWNHLDDALSQGYDDTHGLQIKIQFLETLLKKRENKAGQTDKPKGEQDE